MINKYGAQRGERGLPKLLPGLNFIAGLNGETKHTYQKNIDLLNNIREQNLLLRRINIRQVEGEGFQEIVQSDFKQFKETVRDEIDKPLLKELFPLNSVLKRVHWESHGARTRLPVHLTEQHTSEECHGNAGITFGRQIGAYPILIGAEYLIPLESKSNIMVTGHGARSITGVEVNLDPNKITEKQLSAVPGIGQKMAWNLITTRIKRIRKVGQEFQYDNFQEWFEDASLSKEFDKISYFSI